MNESFDAISDRIERLERENRRVKWFGAGAILTILALMTAASTRGEPRRNQVEKVIQAQSFIAVNEDGRGVIGIGTNIGEKGKGLIQFLDESGKPRMTLGLGRDDAPSIMLTDRDGRDQLTMEIRTGMGTGISLRDLERNSGLMIGTNPQGVAGIGFMGNGGKLVMELGMNPDGSSRFILRDKDGEELFRLPKP